MSAAADASRDAGTLPQGTVFDIGYQGYSGRREGRGRARRAIFKDGLRIALGLGRGPRAKVLPWAFIGLLAGIALIMALIAGAADRLAGPGAAERMNLPSHADFYGIASIILYVFAALVAPELLCRDRREGGFNDGCDDDADIRNRERRHRPGERSHRDAPRFPQ